MPYFIPSFVQEGIEHILNWSSQLPHTFVLQNQGFQRPLLQTSGTSRLHLM